MARPAEDIVFRLSLILLLATAATALADDQPHLQVRAVRGRVVDAAVVLGNAQEPRLAELGLRVLGRKIEFEDDNGNPKKLTRIRLEA